MTITLFFKRLGAPLRNSRWSWGSVRPDGAVLLRVWKDEVIRRDGVSFVVVMDPKFRSGGAELGGLEDYGLQERLDHLSLVAQGARCYMVMCEAKNRHEIPRNIKTFNDHDLFVGGRLEEMEGREYIEIAGRLSVPRFLAETG